MIKLTETEVLARNIESQLFEKYGTMIGSKDLWRSLGYPSPSALRQAVSRKTLEVPLFELPKRRGRFALVRDVALWIAKQRLG
jgi:hypothetical protein